MKINQLLRFQILVFTFIALSVSAKAQQTDATDDTIIARIRQYKKETHTLKEGMLFPDFKAITTDGMPINNESLKGMICLLVFWDPWCNCYQPEHLKEIPEITNRRKDFKIISMMWDTGRLAEFIRAHPQKITVAKLATNEMMQKLIGGNGIPYCYLINRNGMIVKDGEPHFYQKEFADKIKELLMF